MKCNHCGKEGVHVCISAGFSALVLADQLGESAMLPYATSELRRLHDENEALKAAQYECGFGAGCYQAAKSEADEALLRQCVSALEGAITYDWHGNPSEDYDRECAALVAALRKRLGETK